MKTAAFLLAFTVMASAQVRLPPYSREVLANGVVLDVMPRSGVPLVAVEVRVKGGAESDPAEMAGLGGLLESNRAFLEALAAGRIGLEV